MHLVATNFLTFIANFHMMGRKCCWNARKLMSWFVDIFYLGWNDAKNRKNILSCERESTKIRILVTHPYESGSRYMIGVIWSHSLFSSYPNFGPLLQLQILMLYISNWYRSSYICHCCTQPLGYLLSWFWIETVPLTSTYELIDREVQRPYGIDRYNSADTGETATATPRTKTLTIGSQDSFEFLNDGTLRITIEAT